jgi:hypothetical protein
MDTFTSTPDHAEPGDCSRSRTGAASVHRRCSSFPPRPTLILGPIQQRGPADPRCAPSDRHRECVALYDAEPAVARKPAVILAVRPAAACRRRPCCSRQGFAPTPGSQQSQSPALKSVGDGRLLVFSPPGKLALARFDKGAHAPSAASALVSSLACSALNSRIAACGRARRELAREVRTASGACSVILRAMASARSFCVPVGTTSCTNPKRAHLAGLRSSPDNERATGGQ